MPTISLTDAEVSALVDFIEDHGPCDSAKPHAFHTAKMKLLFAEGEVADLINAERQRIEGFR
jgi:hypothetical protein